MNAALACICYLVTDPSHALTRGRVTAWPSLHRALQKLVLLRARMTCLTRGKLPTAFETKANVYIKMQEAILKGCTN